MHQKNILFVMIGMIILIMFISGCSEVVEEKPIDSTPEVKAPVVPEPEIIAVEPETMPIKSRLEDMPLIDFSNLGPETDFHEQHSYSRPDYFSGMHYPFKGSDTDGDVVLLIPLTSGQREIRDTRHQLFIYSLEGELLAKIFDSAQIIKHESSSYKDFMIFEDTISSKNLYGQRVYLLNTIWPDSSTPPAFDSRNNLFDYYSDTEWAFIYPFKMPAKTW